MENLRPYSRPVYYSILSVAMFTVVVMAGSSMFRQYPPRYIADTGDMKLIMAHVVGNMLIALSSLVVGVLLFYFSHKGAALLYRNFILHFATSVFLCGVTHVFDVIAIWKTYYWVDTFFRTAAGITYVYTMVRLPGIVRTVLKLRGYNSVTQELLEKTKELESERVRVHDLKNELGKMILILREESDKKGQSDTHEC